MTLLYIWQTKNALVKDKAYLIIGEEAIPFSERHVIILDARRVPYGVYVGTDARTVVSPFYMVEVVNGRTTRHEDETDTDASAD